jgi:hypothetical protein
MLWASLRQVALSANRLTSMPTQDTLAHVVRKVVLPPPVPFYLTSSGTPAHRTAVSGDMFLER